MRPFCALGSFVVVFVAVQGAAWAQTDPAEQELAVEAEVVAPDEAGETVAQDVVPPAEEPAAESDEAVVETDPGANVVDTQAITPVEDVPVLEEPASEPDNSAEETAGDEATEDDDGMSTFYKGDLGRAGGSGLVPTGDAVFVGLGYYNIGGILGAHYLRIEPMLDLHLEPWENKQLTLRFGVPINLLIWDQSDRNRSFGNFRKQDYDEVGDYLKLIRSIQLGRKEERLFVNVGLLHNVSIGHGAVIRRYNANLDSDRTRLGLQFDAYNDYGGFETFIADVAMQSRLMGGLLFVKPLSLFTDNGVAKSLSLGVHYTADLNAPKSLKRTGPAGGIQTVSVDSAGYPEFEGAAVGIWGVDAEVKPLRFGNMFDLKVYGDFSQISDAGSGITGGLLVRSNLGSRPFLSALRARVEVRNYEGNYVPQYFDSLYEIQKFQLVQGQPTGNEPTKYESIINGVSGDRQTSVYGEATYSLVDNLVVGVGLEAVTGNQSLYNLLLHLEVPAFEILRLFLSYQKRGYGDLSDSFSLADNGRSFQADTIFLAQVRLMLLPFMFVSAGAQQTFQFDPLYKGGSYVPSLDVLATVEIGWEFDS